MKSTLIDVSGKLSDIEVAVYSSITVAADGLGIRFLVVGAAARDLVFEHAFGAAADRATEDLDFAIDVASWNDFRQLADELLKRSYTADPVLAHRFHYEAVGGFQMEIDLVPFGDIADTGMAIHWPPDHDVEMSVRGFDEALRSALEVRVATEPDTLIAVASPVGMVLLKLVAWLDRTREKRSKDAQDLGFLIRKYPAIPQVEQSLYEEGFMAAHDYDIDRASAAKLGLATGALAFDDTRAFLTRELFAKPNRMASLAREIRIPGVAAAEAASLLGIFKAGFG